MKKLIALTLASLMLLTGCSSAPKTEGNETTPTPEAAATEADVIVVGAGGAGMTAAIEAANAGKSVIVIEKAAMTGGNTTRSTGGMNAANTPEQDKNEFTEGAGVEKMLASAKESYPDLADLVATVEAQWEEYQANPTGYFDTE